MIKTNEMDRFKLSECEVVKGGPDRVNIPCLVHDTNLTLMLKYS